MALIFCHDGWAQEIKITKSIDKTFKVDDRLNLEITNKYGNVIIDTWSKNEVSLKIEILAYGKDRDAAEKLMDRVEFDFKQASDFLQVESVFDRKKSFFKDLINTVGDYSASLLSNHKLQVNYELNIPESAASVTVDNRFGDVHLGDIEGRITVTLAHGNLKANKMVDYSRVNINYGNAKIQEINEGRISLKGAELELDFGQKIDLESSSSTITIGKVSIFDLQSTNDKININEVRDISGSANFTELAVGTMNESCRLNQSYGGMKISYIPNSFTSIRLDGKSTDYELNFSNKSSFESRIYTRDDKINLADYPGQREKRYVDEKSKFVQITGYFGSKNSDHNVNIDAQNGEVKIDFIDGNSKIDRNTNR
jgi:hypothetical protein